MRSQTAAFPPVFKEGHEDYPQLRKALLAACTTLRPDALEALQKANRRSSQIGEVSFLTGHSFVLISPQTHSEFFRDVGTLNWAALDGAELAGGLPGREVGTYCELSRVGFDIGSTQAVIYVHHEHGPGTGAASCFVFRRTKEGWQFDCEYTLMEM